MQSPITRWTAALIVCLCHEAGSQMPSELRPQPAVQAVLAAFDRYPVVALGMSHELQEEARLVVAIVRDPRFTRNANAVVVECGNALYQSDMDRYVGGEMVPLQRLQRFWRNTTQPGLCDGPEVRELVDAIRDINARLPRDRQVRLLAGDPPIDWDRARSTADVAPFLGQRDTYFASVVERDVLARQRKALLVIGTAHVLHRSPRLGSSHELGPPTVPRLIEKSQPDSVFVITPHDGFSERNEELEARLATWPTPSLATIHNTWLGQLDAGLVFASSIQFFGPSKPPDPFSGLKLQDVVDAYLYLGPKASLHDIAVPPPDSAYARELARRRRLFGGFGPPPLRPRPGDGRAR